MKSRWRVMVRLISAAASCALLGMHAAVVRADVEAGRVKIEYIAPKDEKYQSLYQLLKDRRALEQLQRLFSPLKLPSELTIQTSECNGIANAWYERGKVTICYELLDQIRRPMPADVSWAGITQADAIVGQFLFISAHEIGHAVFHLLEVPIFGNEEDAADQFAAYSMLRLGKDQARRLVFGAAYYHRKHIQKPTVTLSREAFADTHGKPQQRFFNLLCVSYGANPEIFAEVVEKGYLPKGRSGRCRLEYRRVERAVQRLIQPHVDRAIAKEVLDETWLSATAP
jgi:hypothetical protein